jgi:hypothetical protein
LGRPRTAQKIKTHTKEVGLYDKGGLILSFVTFSGSLLCGGKKENKNNNLKYDESGYQLSLLLRIAGCDETV